MVTFFPFFLKFTLAGNCVGQRIEHIAKWYYALVESPLPIAETVKVQVLLFLLLLKLYQSAGKNAEQ